MSKLIVHAGDFIRGKNQISFGSFILRTDDHSFMGETIYFSQLESVEVANEDSVKRVGGTLGWGVAGAALLGPVGLLAGLLLGGRGKDITFVAIFKDGRKLMATTDSKTFTKLSAAVF